MWTLGRRLAVGFALSLALLLVVGVTSYRGVGSLSTSSQSVAHTHDVLERLALVLGQLTDAETGQRGFVITGNEVFLAPYHAALGDIGSTLAELRQLTSDNAKQQRRLDEAEPLVEQKLAELATTVDMRRREGFEPTAAVVARGDGQSVMDELRRVLGEMEQDERGLLEQRAADVQSTTSAIRTTIFGVTLLCIVLVSAVGVAIARSVGNQVGSAVRSVQSSSAELQAAANQQLTSTKEQVTAMTEITTTINELLATSRQIAEGAQRVAQTAGTTARSATSGNDNVTSAHQSIEAIRRQVDLLVTHMIELGHKSQQIGSIVDIVSELAEQTNILAINATIEAAGAGTVGSRFGVVADEIRKLADRVAGSAKEIRTLIDDVRSAVNTSVMVTEGGSKAVLAGQREFGGVATSFKQIAELVSTTTEASREIELSTKQQATAVEQVMFAVSNVSQAARETEASSGETLQTAKQLNSLSRDLMRIVQAESA